MRAIILLLTTFIFTGCLTFHKIAYKVTLEGRNKGKAEVHITDIRSDARSDFTFEEDKKNLFNYILESKNFIDTMKNFDRHIKERELFVKNDTLNGRIVFEFNNIAAVEAIVYEDGFYFLTLPPEDSVISTNGEVIISPDRKRILWDQNYKTIEFEILGNLFEEEFYRSLAPYYKKK